MVTYVLFDPSNNHIKIGKTKNVLDRLKGYRTHSATKHELLFALLGDHEDLLHVFFQHLRAHGKWFNDETGEIRRALQFWFADLMLDKMKEKMSTPRHDALGGLDLD